MRLTRYTDHSLRVLIHLGARPERMCAISEIAQTYGISQNHLMKVVHDLRKAGYVASARGRFGGIRLAKPANDISVGAVVRGAEEGFELADCANCAIAPACGLTGALAEALAAFMAVLDGYTLGDLIGKRGRLRALLGALDAAEA